MATEPCDLREEIERLEALLCPHARIDLDKGTAECPEVERLEARHRQHLRLIRRLSTDSISPEEAAELQAQVAALVSQVGTCRGYVRELLEILDDTCAKKWRARLATIRTEVE